jgi:protein-L-isoaspartate(D-aspartate) O-methyltransferase
MQMQDTPNFDDGLGPDVALRDALVAQLEQHRRLAAGPVVEALRVVPRHLFLPDVPLERAYADEAVVTKWGADHTALSSASQPAMIAIMLEQLDVAPGMRVLEIGTGTGYNAALLAHMVGLAGHIVTVELDAEIAAAAREHLAAAGLGPDRVTVITGDGALGWSAGAPYDRIILTAGAWDVAPAWFAQLCDGGRLVLPLALHTLQMSAALERQGDVLRSTSLRPCGFIRLRGPFAGPEVVLTLPDLPGVKLLVEPPLPPPGAVAYLLRTQPRTGRLDIPHPDGLRYALACLAGPVATVLASASHPPLGSGAVGIITPEGDSACFLVWECTGAHSTLRHVEYGAATAGLQMEQVLDHWQALGCPTLDAWRLTLHPRTDAAIPPATSDDTFWLPKEYWLVEVRIG